MLSQLNGSCTHSVREYDCDIGYYVLRPKTDVVAVKNVGTQCGRASGSV